MFSKILPRLSARGTKSIKKASSRSYSPTEANKAISIRIDSKKKRIVVRDFVSEKIACGFLIVCGATIIGFLDGSQ